MCQGICKDRLADAFQRFGRVPIEKRRIVVPPDHAAFEWDEDPFWSAGGLIHDGRGRVLLIRHRPAAGWGDAWVTPGGRLEEGETTLDGLHREVQEEVGVAVVDPILTRILQQTLSDGRRTRHRYFAQFVARAASDSTRTGPDVQELGRIGAVPTELASSAVDVSHFSGIARASVH